MSLGRLLAIPDDEAIRLGRLARQVGPVFEQFASAEQHRIDASAVEELVGRLAMIVSGHGDDGARDNLLAGLAATRAATGEEERLGTAVLLFGAGFDSPASMVGLGAKLLIECPQQACLVAGKPRPHRER